MNKHYSRTQFYDYDINWDVPEHGRNERNTLAVPAASEIMYQRETNRWERLRMIHTMIEDLKAKWNSECFFFKKIIKRVEGENYVSESILTLKEPEEFYKPTLII